MHRHCVVSAVLVAASLVGCSSSGSPSKPPAAATASSTPSAVKSASTSFTSNLSSVVGLRFTWPTPGWRPVETIYDLAIHPPGLPGATLHVTKGLFPTDPTGRYLETKVSATGVIAALRGMSALQSSRPVRDHIGDGIAAARVDIRLAPTAPASGFAYLTDKVGSGIGSVFSIKKGMVVRVYAAAYTAPYGHELLNIAVEAPDAKVFARWTRLAARALQSMRLPQGFVPAHTFRANEWD